MYPSNRFLNNLSSLQGLQVLIVDNNVDCCDLITILLQLYGVEVQQAFSAPQALEIFEQWQPYIVVSDISLPKEDGYALIQKVKSKAKERGQVVLAIAVTGYADEKMCERALSGGFDLWFTKPLDIDEFVAVLACLAVCQQSSYAIAQRILDHVPKYGDLSLEQQLEASVSS
ncbi:response regulator [Tolypothrix sp. FACHB-123]|uniref:response regulator n=1 Tax=Tolypothrix sp. FACHB-123 TaxID=2692868 RepID=UPI001687FE0C|nr:response regulator [Tolypothrix sp. FACHB-123]MBD2356085.1 response regulator [Tolypothrix sp. FACHB-123]